MLTKPALGLPPPKTSPTKWTCREMCSGLCHLHVPSWLTQVKTHSTTSRPSWHPRWDTAFVWQPAWHKSIPTAAHRPTLLSYRGWDWCSVIWIISKSKDFLSYNQGDTSKKHCLQHIHMLSCMLGVTSTHICVQILWLPTEMGKAEEEQWVHSAESPCVIQRVNLFYTHTIIYWLLLNPNLFAFYSVCYLPRISKREHLLHFSISYFLLLEISLQCSI